MSRLFPEAIDADTVILKVLRDAGVAAFVERPREFLDLVPCVILTALGGKSVGVGVHEQVTYIVECWDSTREAARDLALDVRVAAYAAWFNGANTRVNTVDVSATPTPEPTGVDGFWRFDAEITVSVRA